MRADFRLGDWIIRPRRDCIERGDEIVHVHPRPMTVLECLAAAGGEVVTRDELFDTVWPGVIVTDDALTQCIVELRRAFGDSAHHAQIIKTIPKVGFCLVPPVTFLTEKEMASGEKLNHSAAGMLGSMKPKTWSTLVTVVIILLALAMYWYLNGPRDTTVTVHVNPIPSIAVLPFADMSENQDQEYFAEGLSEELLNSLARVEGLKVTGRTSSFYFRDKNEKLQVISETLGVSYLLEGSVRKDGEQLRITAQLLDASSGFHLWSETYDRKLENIFAVQEEISGAIIGALKEQLGLQLEVPLRVIATTNTEAHDAYLRGRHLVIQRTRSTIEGAAREFERAISLDPDYALAHAELAIASVLLKTYGGLTRTEAEARAAPHAERAMALDPGLAEAHAAAGYLSWSQDNVEEALAHFRRAVQINPNYSIVYLWMGNLLHGKVNNYEESFAAQTMAWRLDPLSIPAISNYVRALITRDRLDEAERELEKLAFMAPYPYAHIRGMLTSLGGQWANAVLNDLDAFRIDPEGLGTRRVLSHYFALFGLEEEALAMAKNSLLDVLLITGKAEDAVTLAEARLAEDPMSPGGRDNLGMALVWAGDYVRARPILEEMWQLSGGRVRGERVRVVRGSQFHTHNAASLIAIRRDAGAGADVGELLAAIRDHVRRCRDAGIIRFANRHGMVDYNEGLANYLDGEREKGLALIAKGMEDGYFTSLKAPYLQELYDDPGFAPIRARRKARLARERKKFLDVVCNDNPYADVWQPAEGTCERFLAEAPN
jgi:TolB-like protein/DNA-binding winged helix-turn-helix (wHTH) protein